VVHTRDTAAAGTVLSRLGLSVVPDGVRPATAGIVDGAGTVRAAVGPRTPAPEEIVAALVASGVGVRGFSVEGTSLEERFVQLTGEGFDIA
jgi:ABC-2 type transport system ATP-binding protein